VNIPTFGFKPSQMACTMSGATCTARAAAAIIGCPSPCARHELALSSPASHNSNVLSLSSKAPVRNGHAKALRYCYQCICRATLTPKEASGASGSSSLCSHCASREGEIYTRSLAAVNSLEQQFGELFVCCVVPWPCTDQYHCNICNVSCCTFYLMVPIVALHQSHMCTCSLAAVNSLEQQHFVAVWLKVYFSCSHVHCCRPAVESVQAFPELPAYLGRKAAHSCVYASARWCCCCCCCCRPAVVSAPALPGPAVHSVQALLIHMFLLVQLPPHAPAAAGSDA
jgi:hypothetical protein